jgi:hypothetical protein
MLPHSLLWPFIHSNILSHLDKVMLLEKQGLLRYARHCTGCDSLRRKFNTQYFMDMLCSPVIEWPRLHSMRCDSFFEQIESITLCEIRSSVQCTSGMLSADAASGSWVIRKNVVCLQCFTQSCRYSISPITFQQQTFVK